MATNHVHYDFNGQTYSLRLSPITGEVTEVYREVTVKNAQQPHVRRQRIRGDRFYDIARQYHSENGIIVRAD